MSNLGHTPGPWIVDTTMAFGPYSILSTSPEVPQAECIVCSFPSYRRAPAADRRGRLEADARLIAAAPVLLDACRAVLEFWGSHEAWGDFASLNSAAAAFAPVADRARAAFAQAAGEEEDR